MFIKGGEGGQKLKGEFLKDGQYACAPDALEGPLI